ncbi:MAG: DUF262 domain-containing protein [Nitrospirae bacterium]|nr:DUF262 domain-containing protein [Nitrospirota bacterium]
MKVPLLNRESNTITIATFHENYLLKKYNLNPPYQRHSVWSDEKQSFLIDSILKNFPMPPIFLRQNIDDNSGKTTYDVIDGKQRLTSIIRFINNEIPAATELENTEFDDPDIAGKYFRELDNSIFSEYKRKFWRYAIPIEYVDASSATLIDNIFDRLNRNGEPLEGQELRHAKYHASTLYKKIVEVGNNPFWKERLKNVDRTRMEDDEFTSELVFILLKGQILASTQTTIDELYSTFENVAFEETFSSIFIEITDIMAAFQLNYEELQISGVSHLYGLWCFAWYCQQNRITAAQVNSKLFSLFTELRSGNIINEQVLNYKRSMLSNTKSKSQRDRRLQALVSYCGL